MQRPWVLFDIDGVLNPFFNDLADFTGYAPFHTPFSSWLINSELHGAWLRDLELLADFHWASMWRGNSNALNEAYRLRRKAYPHVEWLDWFPNEDQTFKLPTIKHQVGNRRPIIWVDDDLNEDAYAWADARGRTLLIHCDPTRGWTEAEYDTIVFFLANAKHLTKVGDPLQRRVITRLHRVREIAARYRLSELRMLTEPDLPQLTFEVQLTDLAEAEFDLLRGELAAQLDCAIVLQQQENGRKHSVALW